jgi:hypothetical protein
VLVTSVVKVTVAFAPAAVGTTAAAEEQVVSAGNPPLQVRLTGESNPFTDVSVKVIVPDLPCCTIRADGLAVMLKLPGCGVTAAVIVSVRALDVEASSVLLPEYAAVIVCVPAVSEVVL